jgi:predicted unusual protein kinase regulating ubiquinone biosynthesis (AarF/ABC1/UbiB family)
MTISRPPPLSSLSAGNLACDAVQGGRLIYYDFGMMDEFQPGVKKGLVSISFHSIEREHVFQSYIT